MCVMEAACICIHVDGPYSAKAYRSRTGRPAGIPHHTYIVDRWAMIG
jgi:hypothetical protein